jgi:hypothetical protein
MENKVKHLEMIQAVITRMAANSFHLKEWTVVLVSAILAVAASKTSLKFIYISYLPTTVFWILDGYFLWQERLFRKLFDRVRTTDGPDSDFSLDTSVIRHDVKPWIMAIFSTTLIIFYVSIILGISIIVLIGLIR